MVMRAVLTWLLWALAAGLTVLLILMVVLPRLMGWVPLTVLTGSMEPTIAPGAQVIIKPVGTAEEISVGDVVTYMPYPDDDTLITHRVVAVSVDAQGTHTYTLRGDANDADDPQPVRLKQIKGVMVYHLPLTGHIALAISGRLKIAILAAAGVALLGYAAWQLRAVIGDYRGNRSHRRSAAKGPRH